jgi:hypothetical protein
MPNKVENFATHIKLDNARQTLIHVLQDQLAKRGADEIRDVLKKQYGEQVWNSEQLLEEFEVSHFDPPYVHVIRKRDALAGTVAFNDEPRFYFSFKPTKVDHDRGAT